MSGKGGAGAIIGGIIGGAAGFFVGGPVGAVVGASAGGAVGGGVGAKQDAAQASRAQKALRNDLLKPISTPQVMPTADNAAVQKAKANELTQLQNRSGRASTVLTNQFGG